MLNQFWLFGTFVFLFFFYSDLADLPLTPTAASLFWTLLPCLPLLCLTLNDTRNETYMNLLSLLLIFRRG